MIEICGLIAVRSGSERIHNKNIRPFANTSLLEIKLEQAKNTTLLKNVFVSSDSDEMLNIARRYKAIPLKRDPYFATNTVPMNLAYEYMAKQLTCEHIAYLHVTSPLLKKSTLEKCIETYIKLENNFDSLCTVSKVQEYLWKDNKPLNYDPNAHPRSQDLPDVYSLNFAVNIISRKKMIKRKNIVGQNFYPFIMDKEESVDIDTELDFKIAEFIYQQSK